MTQHELKQILQAITRHPKGISAAKLRQTLRPTIPYRTLLRRLDKLMTAGKIRKEGKARNTLYKFCEDDTTSSRAMEQAFGLLLSPTALQLKARVNRPLSARKSVNYNMQFLKKYQPNTSFYLSPQERKHLLDIGQQSAKKQPAGTFARNILDRFLIDLSWNSSRLEGNTYSLLETDKLLIKGKTVAGKTALETQMLINHKAAIEFMAESSDLLAFNHFTICNLHGFLSDALLGDPSASGRLRTIAVEIHGTCYHPLDIPQLIEEYFRDILTKAAEIKDPFEQAFFALVQIPYLQAFQDVNKRVSRLAANIPFFKNNLCPISFVDVDEKNYIEGLLAIYEMNRIELLKEVFIWAYERSTHRYTEIQQLLGAPDPFRLKYRAEIYALIKMVIVDKLSKTLAIKRIREKADQNIPAAEQGKFIEIVENELRAIHGGNFARYRVTPTQFERWQKQWQNTNH